MSIRQQITEIKDVSMLAFKEHHELLNKLNTEIKTHPTDTLSYLPTFYKILDGQALKADLLPISKDILFSITQNLPQPQIQQIIDTLDKSNKSILIERSGKSLCQIPTCANIMFDRYASRIETTQNPAEQRNYLQPLVRNLVEAVSGAEVSKLPTMFNKIESFAPEVQSMIFPSLGKLYTSLPSMRENIWNKITHYKPKEAGDFAPLYKNLGQITQTDNSKVSECLGIIRQNISHPDQDQSDLKNAYTTLGEIRNTSPDKEPVDQILTLGLQHPANNTRSRKVAFRLMGKTDELTSRASIGQRTEKSDDNPHGFKHTDEIPSNEAAILFLGGNATNSDKSANGYLSSIEKLLHEHNIKDKIGLYAAIYNFGEIEDKAVRFNDSQARLKLMHDHHRTKETLPEMNDDTLHPHYVDDLFQKTLLHRISDKDGKKLSTDDACAKIRGLTIVAHCHGAYTFLKLEEKMQQKMQELGYQAEERAKIQKELLCVAHAAYAPLGVSKSTMISFISAKDFDIKHHNNFEREIRRLAYNNKVKLSYFPGKQGEFFLTPTMGSDTEQHNFLGYDTQSQNLSKEGTAILKLAGNTIANGVKNSLENKPRPSVKELVCGQDETSQKVFETLKANGAELWEKISQNTTRYLKIQYKKGRS